MWIKYGALFLPLIFLMSCTEQDRFPPMKSNKLPVENVDLLQPLPINLRESTFSSAGYLGFSKELDSLLSLKSKYELRDGNFDLRKFEQLWLAFQPKTVGHDFTFSELEKWVQTNGFLLQLTADEKYAGELERLIFAGVGEMPGMEAQQISELFEPYVFTINIDNIYVNLFANATYRFDHTLGGAALVTQETGYPASAKVSLVFEMGKKRYMEVFVRIPAWAENASVTVKKVKYLAVPGSYCQIAKTWKTGDVVEIDFGIRKPL